VYIAAGRYVSGGWSTLLPCLFSDSFFGEALEDAHLLFVRFSMFFRWFGHVFFLRPKDRQKRPDRLSESLSVLLLAKPREFVRNVFQLGGGCAASSLAACSSLVSMVAHATFVVSGTLAGLF
jgi:hypothetical protein